MKKYRFYLVFACLIFSFLLLVSNVSAEYRVYYSGCCKLQSAYSNAPLEVAGAHDGIDYYTQVLSSGDKPASCLDSNFTGWVVVSNSGMNCLTQSGALDTIDIYSNKVSNSNCKIFKSNEGIPWTLRPVDEYKLKAVSNSGEYLNDCSNATEVQIMNKESELGKDVCNVSYDSCDVNRNVKNKQYHFCSPNGLAYVGCGGSSDIPVFVPQLVSYAVTFLKTITPLVLIIISIIQLVKAIASSKEDDMKKAKDSLIKRIIAAALVFFVITIVQFVVLKLSSDDNEKEGLKSCFSCFLNGTDKCSSLYYKDASGNHCSISN